MRVKEGKSFLPIPSFPGDQDDMDVSEVSLGDEDQVDFPDEGYQPKAKEEHFMDRIEQSLEEYEDTSDESSYWSSSDDDDSEEDSSSDDGSGAVTSGDECQATDDEIPDTRKSRRETRSKAKRSDSSLSLDALIKLKMQMGDTRKAPTKDRKEARRGGRRLTHSSSTTTLGALALKVGSSTGNEILEAVANVRRTESMSNIYAKLKPRKFVHVQQEGSPQATVGNGGAMVEQRKRNDVAKCGEQAKTPVKPRDHYTSILKKAGLDVPMVRYETLVDSFFLPLTAGDKAAFDMELVGAVRDQNLKKLMAIQKAGHPLQARSQFGESLVHICARRGTPEMLRFLLQQGSSCRVCCDYGRTPLHDAAWSMDAKSREMMKILIHECPDILLVVDKRGFTPLDYIPKDRWSHCCAFLDKYKEAILPTGVLYGDDTSSSEEDESDESGSESESEGE